MQSLPGNDNLKDIDENDGSVDYNWPLHWGQVHLVVVLWQANWARTNPGGGCRPDNDHELVVCLLITMGMMIVEKERLNLCRKERNIKLEILQCWPVHNEEKNPKRRDQTFYFCPGHSLAFYLVYLGHILAPLVGYIFLLLGSSTSFDRFQPTTVHEHRLLLLSPSGDLGIRLVWDNPTTTPDPTDFLVRLLESS